MNNQSSHNADAEMIAEMQERIDTEMKKPVKDRDYALIDRLTSAVYSAVSGKEIDVPSAIKELNILKEKAEKETKRNRWKKTVVCLASCLIAVYGLNVWSVHTYGQNFYDLTYRIIRGGVTFSPAELASSSESDTKHDADSECSDNDSYEIKSECEKYMPNPLAPTYIPEQFTALEPEVNERPKSIGIDFRFENKNQIILLMHTYFKTEEALNATETGLTVDDPNNVYTECICGHDIVMKWEDDSFEGAFRDGQILYHVWTLHVPQEEAYKVLCSYFK